MNQQQRDYFIQKAKEGLTFEPAIPKGYVFVGSGNLFEKGLTTQELGAFAACDKMQGWRTDVNFIGNVQGCNYACQLHIWEKSLGVVQYADAIKESNDITLKEIKTRLAAAKKWIGKTVKDKKGSLTGGVVEKVDLILDKAVLDSEPNSVFVEEFFAKNGYVIRVDYGKDWSNAFEELKESFDFVTVNGHEAEESGGVYTFGCVKISKLHLIAAKDFLNCVYANSNKQNKSVKIGDFEFTLETLNKLI